LKWSRRTIALVPLGVVTRTSTVPTGSAGATATIDVLEVTVKLAAAIEPNSTAVAPVKLLPVIVTVVSVSAGPFFGDTFLTLGAGGVLTVIVPTISAPCTVQ
jgi:hypothetical protein